MVRRLAAVVLGLAVGAVVYLAAHGHTPTWYGPVLLAGSAAVLVMLAVLSLTRSRSWSAAGQVLAAAEADHAAIVAARPNRDAGQVTR